MARAFVVTNAAICEGISVVYGDGSNFGVTGDVMVRTWESQLVRSQLPPCGQCEDVFGVAFC